jgi:RNA polymerase sigma-70 factor, ECF subfamily
LIEGESDDDRPDDDRLDDAAPNAAHDAALLRAHVDGDPDAFAALVARHQDRMWSIALGIMRNPEDAADALQDAYIAAFRRAGSFRGDARVTTWLHRVVVNACLDRLRMMRSRETEPLPEILIDGAGWARH